MEDPLTVSAADAFQMLDSEMPSFSYPDTYLDYQVPDFFNPSYLSGAHLTTTTTAATSYPSDEGPHSALTSTAAPPLDFPKPHDDLSHFFADSPFSSPTPNQRFVPTKGQGQQTYSPAWGSQEGWSNGNNNNNNHINNNNNNNNSQAPTSQGSPLAILTSGFEPGDARTVVHHGQVTPGDSPETASSPGPAKGRAASSRRASRKGKESISSIATATTVASATSSRRDSGVTTASSPPAEAPAKVKKPRKPRRSSKKPTTAEQAALKRETFLKRNREAAYKCRVKKKTQTEEVVERVKALGEDNRSKAAEVERLRREVEGLRGLLLPHYRVCGDERVVAYLDGLGSVGGAWGGGATRGSLAGLGGEMGGLGLGGDEGSVGGSVSGSEGYNNAGEQEMMGDEMDDEEEEEEREEQRRRESEEMEEMFAGAAGSGAGAFDSGVTPVVEGMGGGMMGGVGMGEGMDMMGGAGGMGGGMMDGGMDEVLGLGMEMEMEMEMV